MGLSIAHFIYRCLCMESTIKIINLYPNALLLYVIMLLNDYLMCGQTPKTKASCGTLNTFILYCMFLFMYIRCELFMSA